MFVAELSKADLVLGHVSKEHQSHQSFRLSCLPFHLLLLDTPRYCVYPIKHVITAFQPSDCFVNWIFFEKPPSWADLPSSSVRSIWEGKTVTAVSTFYCAL